MTGERRAVSIGPLVTLRVVLVTVAVLGTIWLLYELRSVLVLAFLAGIIAAGVLGPERWLEERGVPRPAAVGLVYLALIGLFGVVLLLIVPGLVTQVVDLASRVPSLARTFTERYRPVLEQLGLGTDGASLLDLALSELGGLTSVLATFPLAFAGFLGNFVTVIFLSGLMVLERSRARDWIMRFVVEGDRETLTELAEKSVQRLGAYVRGQLLIMSVTGTGAAVGLTFLGVPFALPLGLLAFLTEAIPLAGPILAGAVMVGVALLESPAQAAGVVVLMFAIQQLEGFVLIPVVQGRVISIAPVVALLAVLSGSALGGIVGAIVAIPIVAIATVVIDDVVLPWRRRHIGAATATS